MRALSADLARSLMVTWVVSCRNAAWSRHGVTGHSTKTRISREWIETGRT